MHQFIFIMMARTIIEEKILQFKLLIEKTKLKLGTLQSSCWKKDSNFLKAMKTSQSQIYTSKMMILMETKLFKHANKWEEDSKEEEDLEMRYKFKIQKINLELSCLHPNLLIIERRRRSCLAVKAHSLFLHASLLSQLSLLWAYPQLQYAIQA